MEEVITEMAEMTTEEIEYVKWDVEVTVEILVVTVEKAEDRW